MKLNPFAMMRIEFDNEGIVYDPENNKAMALNITGVFIWKAIEDGKSEEEITEALTGKFNVSKEQAAQDTAAFLDVLVSKGLLSRD